MHSVFSIIQQSRRLSLDGYNRINMGKLPMLAPTDADLTQRLIDKLKRNDVISASFEMAKIPEDGKITTKYCATILYGPWFNQKMAFYLTQDPSQWERVTVAAEQALNSDQFSDLAFEVYLKARELMSSSISHVQMGPFDAFRINNPTAYGMALRASRKQEKTPGGKTVFTKFPDVTRVVGIVRSAPENVLKLAPPPAPTPVIHVNRPFIS